MAGEKRLPLEKDFPSGWILTITPRKKCCVAGPKLRSLRNRHRRVQIL